MPLQVAQLQADVEHYQGQAETALSDGEAWQQHVQELRTELAEKAGRAAEFGNMQAEVLPSSFLYIGTYCQHQQDKCCFQPLSHASVHFLYPVFVFCLVKKTLNMICIRSGLLCHEQYLMSTPQQIHLFDELASKPMLCSILIDVIGVSSAVCL